MNVIIATGNEGKLREYSQYLESENTIKVLGLADLAKSIATPYEEPKEDYNFFLENAVLKLLSALQYIYNGRDFLAKDFFPFTLVVDDSGLSVPALGFEPGVHSAYYGGLPRSPEKNREKLRENIIQSSQNIKYSDEYRLDGFFICFLCSITINSQTELSQIFSKVTPRGFAEIPLEQCENMLLSELQHCAQDPLQIGAGKTLSMEITKLFSELHLPASKNIYMHFGYCLGEVSSREQQLIENAGHGYDCMFYARQHRDYSFASISLAQKNQESHRAYAMQAFLEYMRNRES